MLDYYLLGKAPAEAKPAPEAEAKEGDSAEAGAARTATQIAARIIRTAVWMAKVGMKIPCRP